jgi:ATP-dependent DNA helicase RecG
VSNNPVNTSQAGPAEKGPITLAELESISVDVLRGVGEKRTKDLERIEVSSVLDLLMFFPQRWVDRTNECRVCDLVEGVESLVVVEVLRVQKRVTRNRMTMVTATVGDDTGRVTLTFFNQPWREKQLREGLTVTVFGKPSEYRGALQLTNPLVDMIGDRTGRIVPIYRGLGDRGVKTWEVAAWVENALARCSTRGIMEPLPAGVVADLGLVTREEALRNMHMPETMALQEKARRRLAFDELLRLQLLLVARKKRLERESRGIRHEANGPLVQRFLAGLPFPLTSAQSRVIAEITEDLARPRPMHRLLQGDVGSGKTMVAVASLVTAVDGGYQGALMAPTEVLAGQHAVGVQRLLDGLRIEDGDNLFGQRPLRVELLTNGVTGEQRKAVLQGIADGSVDIVIGTHALIQDAVKFHRLGVVVIDEQHRFGVNQRAALRDKMTQSGGDVGESPVVPDTLVMTATPIPRTATLTSFGDLDVSVLDELPPGRTPIETNSVMGEEATDAMWAAVRAKIGEGDQAYVVCPMIDESDKLEVAAAEDVFATLSANEMRDHRVGLMHGRMKTPEKESVMETFRRGELDVLVATTVIEVGVDVPNATQMVILDADRFGIAQLHQLRGRVGRGRKASTCWLVTTSAEDEPAGDPGPRVGAIVSSTDGFVLAEIDLALRGAGRLKGTEQRGVSDLELASLVTDRDLIEAARRVAEDLVGEDPSLSAYPELGAEISMFLSEQSEDRLTRS